MDSERRVLDVDGETIREGTSLFNTATEEVLWYDGVRNGMVQLDTLEGSIELAEREFRTRIITDDILIQAQPPDYG